MELPVYSFPVVGSVLLKTSLTIIHVLITHGFAIGLVVIAVIASILSGASADKQPERAAMWNRYGRSLTSAATILTCGLGVIAGAGILISAIIFSPNAAATLVRTFFWNLLAAWLLIIVSLALLLTLHDGWERFDAHRRGRHTAIGGVYLVFAVAGLASLSIVSSFTATPGEWPFTNNLADAMLNPGFFPQLALRLGVSVSLGGIFGGAALIFIRRLDDDFRHEALFVPGLVAALALPLTVAAAWWQMMSIPVRFRTHMLYSLFSAQHQLAFILINTAAGLILVFTVLLMLRGSTRTLRVFVIPAIAAAVLFTAEYERARTFVPNPYLIPGSVYANDIPLIEAPYLNNAGLKATSFWYGVTGKPNDIVSQGSFIFAKNCASCHTVGGVNDIIDRVSGRTEAGLFVILNHTNDMVPFMPPFSGTSQERRTLARFLAMLDNGRIVPTGAETFRFNDTEANR